MDSVEDVCYVSICVDGTMKPKPKILRHEAIKINWVKLIGIIIECVVLSRTPKTQRTTNKQMDLVYYANTQYALYSVSKPNIPIFFLLLSFLLIFPHHTLIIIDLKFRIFAHVDLTPGFTCGTRRHLITNWWMFVKWNMCTPFDHFEVRDFFLSSVVYFGRPILLPEDCTCECECATIASMNRYRWLTHLHVSGFGVCICIYRGPKDIVGEIRRTTTTKILLPLLLLRL